MNTHCECESQARRTQERLQTAADRLATFTRVSWREALGLVAGAPFRVHHYRDVRTRMLHDALCNLDCHEECDA